MVTHSELNSAPKNCLTTGQERSAKWLFTDCLISSLFKIFLFARVILRKRKYRRLNLYVYLHVRQVFVACWSFRRYLIIQLSYPLISHNLWYQLSVIYDNVTLGLSKTFRYFQCTNKIQQRCVLSGNCFTNSRQVLGIWTKFVIIRDYFHTMKGVLTKQTKKQKEKGENVKDCIQLWTSRHFLPSEKCRPTIDPS